jgi:hypothetical protein
MSAIQASTIYIVIRFLDPSVQEPTHALQMLLSSSKLFNHRIVELSNWLTHRQDSM